MSRRKPPPRVLPPTYETGAEERAASVGDYRVDLEGKHAYYVIVHTPTGRIEPRPGWTYSQVHDEVHRLNAAEIVSPKSQGIGRKPRKASPAVEWAELLMRVPHKRAVLDGHLARGEGMSPDDMRKLRTTNWDGQGGTTVHPWLAELGLPPRPVQPAPTKRVTPAARAAAAAYIKATNAYARLEDDLDDAISQQLRRAMGIKRTGWKTDRR